jgi:predicted DNA binding protein
MSRTPEFGIWNSMIQRCTNPNVKSFPRYGGRGISVCERWSGKDGFVKFIADMGRRPDGGRYTIERKDNAKGYSPDNCKWATYSEQQRNTSRSRKLTFKGETLTVAEWGERLGVNPMRLIGRLHRGWSEERTLSEPCDHSTRYRRKSNAVLVTVNGVTKTAAEWAREIGVSRPTMSYRLKHMTPEQAVKKEKRICRR